ncbi:MULTISPECIES: hypothetical protein [Sorangium]|uniref:hypothetical protein n=1 Tax=Sorangium TaxID=39643 RepID=UPI003D9C5D31
MNNSKQILTVDPNSVVIKFAQALGQSNLIVGSTNTVNISVNNKSAYTLQDVTLNQGDIHVLYDDGSGKLQDLTSKNIFGVMIPGGKMVFSSVSASTTSQSQGFFVTPSTGALDYISGKISFSIDSDDITYEVVADTGGQSTSASWSVTTRG